MGAKLLLQVLQRSLATLLQARAALPAMRPGTRGHWPAQLLSLPLPTWVLPACRWPSQERRRLRSAAQPALQVVTPPLAR